MYIPEYSYKTIKRAQIELLKATLLQGEDIEETKELNGIFAIIREPLFESEKLFDDITPIGKKHLSQMMLEPNPKLEKTLYERLHEFEIRKFDNDFGLSYSYSYNQIEEVIKRLKQNPLSKRAVLSLWSPSDINDKYAPPWISSQFLIRGNKLIMITFFRSCDIWNAFPFNCLGIAKLQKEIADNLKIDTGDFIFHIGSAHIYKRHINDIKQYLAKV